MDVSLIELAEEELSLYNAHAVTSPHRKLPRYIPFSIPANYPDGHQDMAVPYPQFELPGTSLLGVSNRRMVPSKGLAAVRDDTEVSAFLLNR